MSVQEAEQILIKYAAYLDIRNKGQFTSKSVNECANLTLDEIIRAIHTILSAYHKLEILV